MILSAAQTNPHQKNTDQNIEQHLLMIDEASHQKVQLIVFPEMSLTGYEREKANELAFVIDDLRLDVFREKAQIYKMMIVVGASVRLQSGLYIGTFIFQTDGTFLIYTKQFLHDGEEQFFSPGINLTLPIKIENKKIAVAICADITNPIHAENAYKSKTDLYLASLFYTPNGIAEAYEQLSEYARKYKMNVLMANFCGESYGLKAAGQSAFWNKEGELKGKLKVDNGEGLLIINSNHEAEFLPFGGIKNEILYN